MMSKSRASSEHNFGDEDNEEDNYSRVEPASIAGGNVEVSQPRDESHEKGESTQSAEVLQSSRRPSGDASGEVALSGPRRAFNHIIQKIREAASYLYKAVASFFAPPEAIDDEKRLDALRKKKKPDPNVEEIRAYENTIFWRNNKDIKSFKRYPEQYTVFDIKHGQQKQKEETPQKAKETAPLGTTVYRQPARGICIGSQQISGAVKVVLDYPKKVAFVQLISPKSEVYATYNVKDIIFLTTCTPLGVAWIGDMYKADNLEPIPEKNKKDKGHKREPLKAASQGPQAGTPAKHVTLQSPGQDSPGAAEASEITTAFDDPSLVPSQSESHVKRRKSAAQRKKQLESEETGRILDELEIEDSDPTEARSMTSEMAVSGGDSRSEARNRGRNPKSMASKLEEEEEEVISIDVVNIVFSNPNQAQRLKSIVETLKSVSWRGLDPEPEPFHGPTYSCSSSSDMSSGTDDTLSVWSSGPKYATSLQNLPLEATGHGVGDQCLRRNSTESPLREYDRSNYYSQNYRQRNVPAYVPSYINADVLEKTQKYLQQVRNNDSHKSLLNSQVMPGINNRSENIFQSQNLQFYQNQFPSRNILENNYSLQNGNVVDLQNQQTAVTQNGYYLQNRPVFPNQNPPVFNSQNPPQHGYAMDDPMLSLFCSGVNSNAVGNQIPLSAGNQMPPTFGNQMSWALGNQMLSTSGNQMPSNVDSRMPLSTGNQIPQTLRKSQLSVSSNFGNTPLQKKSRRIYRNVTPKSIRRQWLASHPEPYSRIRMCLDTNSDNN